ncbi:MAG: hypothetical protein HXY47_08490 [Nitrospirae bacterium]|nr:hypothetical protein [Nitrospirota bacterium]
MTTKIKLIIGSLELFAELSESSSAKKLISLLPIEFNMSRWGDEYYGDCGIKVDLSPDARDIMEKGELAVWPAGNALCIFFGPTPASRGDEPRAVSPVNPIGKLIGDYEALKKLGRSIKVRIEILK